MITLDGLRGADIQCGLLQEAAKLGARLALKCHETQKRSSTSKLVTTVLILPDMRPHRFSLAPVSSV